MPTEFTPKSAELTMMQRRFVEEYLCDPTNASAAARRAGYSLHSAHIVAPQLLRIPKVKAAIEQGQKEWAAKVGITHQRILDELRKIAFANLADFIEVTEDGQTTVNVKSLDRDITAALGEISISKTGKVKTSRVKLHDKLAALEKLAKHLGMFTDKHEHTVITLEDLVNQSMSESEVADLADEAFADPEEPSEIEEKE